MSEVSFIIIGYAILFAIWPVRALVRKQFSRNDTIHAVGGVESQVSATGATPDMACDSFIPRDGDSGNAGIAWSAGRNTGAPHFPRA